MDHHASAAPDPGSGFACEVSPPLHHQTQSPPELLCLCLGIQVRGLTVYIMAFVFQM